MSSAPPSPQADQNQSIQPRAYIVELRASDCLMGRGQPILQWPGNVKFRKLIVEHKEAYLACGKHAAKDAIARQVLSQIEATSGRFLSKIEDDAERDELGVPESVMHAWRIVDETTRLKKVKQALRENLNKSDEGDRDSSASPPRRKKARLKDARANESNETDTARAGSVPSLASTNAPVEGPFSGTNVASARTGPSRHDTRKAPPHMPRTNATMLPHEALESSLPVTSQWPPVGSHDGSPRQWIQQGMPASSHVGTSPSRAMRGLSSQAPNVHTDWNAIQPPFRQGAHPGDGGGGASRDDLMTLLRQNPSLATALGFSQPTTAPPYQRDLTLDILRELQHAQQSRLGQPERDVPAFPLGPTFHPHQPDPHVSLRDMLPQHGPGWPVNPTLGQQYPLFTPAAATTPSAFAAFQGNEPSSMDRLGHFSSTHAAGALNVEPNAPPSWMERYLYEARLAQLRQLATAPSEASAARGDEPSTPQDADDADSKPRANE